MKNNRLLQTGLLYTALLLSTSVSASTIALLESSQTITNTSSTEQTYNFLSTLPTDSLTGAHEETATANFSLLDSDGSGSASMTVNQWHGLINPLVAPPLFDLTLLSGGVFTCTDVISCSADTVTTTILSQQHSDIDHGGEIIDSIGIHLNFTLSPGDSVIFDSSWKVSAVPVPAAAWLFASGLVALLGITGKRRKVSV